MFKKYMAGILACVLTLALTIPMVSGLSSGGTANPSSIGASSSTASANVTLTYEAMMKLPILLVKFTNNGALILNPYRLQYDNGEGSDTDFSASAAFNFGEIHGDQATDIPTSSDTSNPLDGAQKTFRQIISSPLIIESKTVVPIKVGVEVSCAVSSKDPTNTKDRIVMSATRPITNIAKPDLTKKTVCMWMSSGVSKATSGGAGTSLEATMDARSVNPFADYWTKGDGKTKDKPFVILSETKGTAKGVENKAIMTIPAAYYTDTSQSVTSNISSALASIGVLMFDGEMVPMPTDLPWNSQDVITPTVKINLQVMPNPIDSSEVMGKPWSTNYAG